MWSARDCILGQLFSDLTDDPYDRGLAKIGLRDADPAEFGFTHFEVPFSEGGFGMESLKLAWLETIRGDDELVRMRCDVKVELEFDPKTGRVSPTLLLPDVSEYEQLSGPEVTRADQMRVADWSWHDLSFEHNGKHNVEFTVIGYWSKSGNAVAVSVTTDTPRHAIALAPVANSLPGQELVPICALCQGEVVWSAAEGEGQQPVSHFNFEAISA